MPPGIAGGPTALRRSAPKVLATLVPALALLSEDSPVVRDPLEYILGAHELDLRDLCILPGCSSEILLSAPLLGGALPEILAQEPWHPGLPYFRRHKPRRELRDALGALRPTVYAKAFVIVQQTAVPRRKKHRVLNGDFSTTPILKRCQAGS